MQILIAVYMVGLFSSAAYLITNYPLPDLDEPLRLTLLWAVIVVIFTILWPVFIPVMLYRRHQREKEARKDV